MVGGLIFTVTVHTVTVLYNLLKRRVFVQHTHLSLRNFLNSRDGTATCRIAHYRNTTRSGSTRVSIPQIFDTHFINLISK